MTFLQDPLSLGWRYERGATAIDVANPEEKRITFASMKMFVKFITIPSIGV